MSGRSRGGGSGRSKVYMIVNVRGCERVCV